MGKTAKLKKVLHAPFTLHSTLLQLIDHEITLAQAGKGGRIIVKVNALTERELIEKLYAASAAGVQIDLILRSICCLRPGVAGLSENIRVRSIVGRFLEHTRIFYFGNQGEPKVYAASADWMDRNLFSRVEAGFPIENPQLKRRIIQQGLENYLQDNQQAYVLDGVSGDWQRVVADDKAAPHRAQQVLMDKLVNN